MKRTSRTGTARKVALVGLAAASITCGKIALSFLPNVEVVTLLTALYGYTFGVYGILASVIFVTVEPLMWGINTWVISYYLYWPFVAFCFMLLGKSKVRNRVLLTGVAVLLTVWFGVLTSLVDTGLFTGVYHDFFRRFAILYVRGIVFYCVQIASNLVVFPTLFIFLQEKLEKTKRIFF